VLRGLLAARLTAELHFVLALNMSAGGCPCEIVFGGQILGFQAADAYEAYAAALLHALPSGAVI
jgi:hypothetical protein